MFLQKAIKYALANMVDHHKLVEESVDKLYSKDYREVIAALNVIEKCLDEHPEIARNLEKLHATKPLVQLLQNKAIDILEPTLTILTFALGNNPSIQTVAIGYNALEYLVSLTKHTDTKIVAKAFGTTSALIRNHQVGEQKFVVSGGLQMLINACVAGDLNMKVKSMNLIRHLLTQRVCSYDFLLKCNVLETICEALRLPAVIGERVDYTENSALALLYMLSRYWDNVLQWSPQTRSSILECIRNRIQHLMDISKEDEEEALARNTEIETLSHAEKWLTGFNKYNSSDILKMLEDSSL
eukprot:GDKK01021225.1.p1 GENE.GDKK01021225.1~~GDKK01021225.1.p1  ORF type:complete len:338 (-),score=57.68 GDKK01021225.1:182-1075(-)